MKIVFLDIDGVLNTMRNWRKQSGCQPFDPEAIAALNHILAVTGAKIVVSSTWRHGKSVAELDALLTLEGIPKDSVIGKTQHLRRGDGDVATNWRTGEPYEITWTRPRRDEIDLWLYEHPEVTGWVAIDDDEEAGPKHLVLCDQEDGLTTARADAAIAMINRKVSM